MSASVRYATRPPSFQHAGQISSRSSYPTFLSVQESVLLQMTWAWRGIYDSFRWGVVYRTVSGDSEIRANVYKSLLLNSLSLLSIWIFDFFLLPLVQGKDKWVHRNIGRFYQVLWLLPVVGVSLYLNGTWCTTIAKRTFLLQHGGRPVATQPMSYTGMLRALATSAYRVVMLFTSFVVSFALTRVPVVGPVGGFIFLCWVDAYYFFEFVWIARGLSLAQRIRHLEERWAYYFAFGLPSAAICTCGSGLANAALFALVFPVYIIMAMHARPVPIDPYNPMPPKSSSKTEGQDIIQHPSPFVPIRIPIFALVIWLNDLVVRVLNFIGGRPIVRHKAAARSRSFNDPTSSESAEDGVAGGPVEMKTMGSKLASSMSKISSPAVAPAGLPPPPLSPSASTAKVTSNRVKIGKGRKVD